MTAHKKGLVFLNDVILLFLYRDDFSQNAVDNTSIVDDFPVAVIASCLESRVSSIGNQACQRKFSDTGMFSYDSKFFGFSEHVCVFAILTHAFLLAKQCVGFSGTFVSVACSSLS